MQQHEKAAFGQLVKDVMAYYGKDTSKFLLDTWWGACQPFAYEQIEKALQRHATDAERGQFAPKVADIVRILGGTATDKAALAWGKAHSAMSSVGSYTDVVFDDPAIHAAIEDLGGWPKVCRTELSELGYLQHRFQTSHKAYTERQVFDYPKRLAGDRSPDSEYEKKGLKLPMPALIGDPKQCELVFRGGGGTKNAVTFVPLSALAAPTIQRLTDGSQS